MPTKIAFKHGVLLLAVFATSFPFATASNVSAQGPYPSSVYNGFEGNQSSGNQMPSRQNFATSRPFQPDFSAADPNDYRSMSPNSWESAGLQEYGNLVPPGRTSGSNGDFHDSPSGQNEFETPSLEPSTKMDSDNSFQSAGFARRRSPEELLNLATAPNVPQSIRYPLPGVQNSMRPPSNNEVPSRNSGQSFPDNDMRNSNTQNSQLHSILRSPENEIPIPQSGGWAYPTPRHFPVSAVESGPNFQGGPNFRPDMGHRDVPPTVRNFGSEDYGQKFDFEEKKKEYPPLGEILATGRYFGSATTLYLRPAFQGNTAIAQTISGNTSTFDFDYEAAPQFQVGFESKFGPGIELTYWQYDETSNAAAFTSNGVESGTTGAWMMGANRYSQLSAANSGETLAALHSIDIETLGINFFKSVQLPISRINGKFGLNYVSISHLLDAKLTDSGASEIGSLRSSSDMRAYGPQFTLEYFRPVGHTKLELMTSFGGSVMFGRQDQSVVNSTTGTTSRVGADELLTMFDFHSGLQYRKMIAENRYWFVRGGFMFQSWLNGGTAIVPQDDFGLRGISFTVGYNR